MRVGIPRLLVYLQGCLGCNTAEPARKMTTNVKYLENEEEEMDVKEDEEDKEEEEEDGEDEEENEEEE